MIEHSEVAFNVKHNKSTFLFVDHQVNVMFKQPDDMVVMQDNYEFVDKARGEIFVVLEA